MKKIFLFVIVAGLLFNFACSPLKNKTANKDLNQLVSMMTGSFNSAEQAKQDSSYFDITLHMYPIWTNNKSNKRYLYVEQTVTSMPTRPYRQRVYEVSQVNNNTFQSVIYKLPDEKSYVGKWSTPTFFDKISPADLELREGCAVYLTKLGDKSFKGSTNEKDCKSTLRGASYATSIVEILPNKVLSWDQGFDSSDKQVWGAVKGGYEFLKVNP